MKKDMGGVGTKGVEGWKGGILVTEDEQNMAERKSESERKEEPLTLVVVQVTGKAVPFCHF